MTTDLFFKKITHKNIDYQVRLIRESGYDVMIDCVDCENGNFIPRLNIVNQDKHVIDTSALRADGNRIIVYNNTSKVRKFAENHDIQFISRI